MCVCVGKCDACVCDKHSYPCPCMLSRLAGSLAEVCTGLLSNKCAPCDNDNGDSGTKPNEQRGRGQRKGNRRYMGGPKVSPVVAFAFASAFACICDCTSVCVCVPVCLCACV